MNDIAPEIVTVPRRKWRLKVSLVHHAFLNDKMLCDDKRSRERQGKHRWLRKQHPGLSYGCTMQMAGIAA